MKRWTWAWFWYWCPVWMVAVIFAWNAFAPRDSTDESGWARSGLMIYRDALTGCEYLGRALGGLTPRLDSKGNPMCRDSL